MYYFDEKEMKRLAKGPNKSMTMRTIVLWAIMLLVTVGLVGGRLVYIMIVQSEFYQQKAAEQQLYDTELRAERGKIYDRNGEMLATSAQVWTVYITPNSFKTIKDETRRNEVKSEIATNLSAILGLEYQTVLDYTNKNTSYVKVKSNVEKPEADLVRQYISDSTNKVGSYIGLDESSKRYYPNDSLASVALGFVGSDNQGLSGLELQYDAELTGVPGRVVAAKDATGNDMPLSYEVEVAATPGNSLVTTLDSYIQYVCEKYLDQAIIDNKVTERGTVICMNVNSGEILGMAVKGDFDPNSPFTLSVSDQAIVDALEGDEKTAKLSELRNKQWRNKSVSDVYEPGSVFKVVTAAMAIEEGKTNLNSHYNCNGYIVVAGRRYNCHKTTGHGAESLTNAMQNSCNPVFITFGQQLGVSTFSKYYEAFGLTKKTGIDLPGEASPVYHTESKMGVIELASSSFGQTFNITPIQMITAISAAVNGGYLVQPHLVSEIVDSNGNTVKTVNNTAKRQVISNETSKLLCGLMEAVVDGGGGRNAYVSGYNIGGKTGTSQKVSQILETGQTNLYIASFCGVAPMDDPEIAVLVILDEPHGEAYYGGTIAAPVGGQILAEILPYLNVEPHYTEEELSNMAVRIPSVTGKTVDEAKKTIKDMGLTYKVIGDGESVLKQFPTTAESIYSDGVVLLYTEENSETVMSTVPDFKGLGVKAANELAAEHNINIQFSGAALTLSGVTSYKQSIPAGTEVESGTLVTVYFRTTETAE